MMKVIHAAPQPLCDIFNKKSYKIPDYQRPYSWTDDECAKLWDDLIGFYEFTKSSEYDNSPYFLGNMVYHKEKNAEDIYYVVDGQQRITTIAILLKILQEGALDYPDLYKLLWKTKSDLNGNVSKIEPLALHVISEVLGNKESEAFVNVMNTNNVEEQLNSIYHNNYHLLKVKVQEWYADNQNEYQNLIDTIVNKIILLPILCDDQDHALTIFETINNRGKSLSDADIFKSQLYKVALHKNSSDLFIEQWNAISEKSNILDLFRIYSYIIRGKVGDTDTEIGLRKFFTTKPNKNRAGLELAKQSNWEDVIVDLEILSSCQMYLQNYAPDKIKKWWYILTLVSNTYVPYLLYTYLFYFLEKSSNDDDILILSKEHIPCFEKLIQACVKYFYGKRLCNITQTSMKHLVYNAIVKFTHNKEYQDIIDDLKNATVGDQVTIEERIDKNDFGRVKTALIHILSYQDPKQEYISAVNIEHILPKKWDHYEYKWEPQLVKENIEKLGNLVLLEESLNKGISNHILSYKQEKAYSLSKFTEFQQEFDDKKSLANIPQWDYEAFYARERSCKTRLKKFFREY